MKQNESFRIKLKWRVSANGNKYDRAIPFDSSQHSRASSQYLLKGAKQSFIREGLPLKQFFKKEKGNPFVNLPKKLYPFRDLQHFRFGCLTGIYGVPYLYSDI